MIMTMKKTIEYKIIKREYYSKAELFSTRYEIQTKKKILGFTTWVYLKEFIDSYDCDNFDYSYKSRISLDSVEAAESFIHKLAKGNPIEGETIHEVKKIVTNENLLR